MHEDDFEYHDAEIEEFSDSYYSDSPDEHEYHDDDNYEDYDGSSGRLYPDPDNDEIFFSMTELYKNNVVFLSGGKDSTVMVEMRKTDKWIYFPNLQTQFNRT